MMAVLSRLNLIGREGERGADKEEEKGHGSNEGNSGGKCVP
jgi:hypothetical protein